MKITLDIPDGTICAFFDFVYRGHAGGLKMQGHRMGTDDLFDGAEIIVEEIEEVET